MKIQTLAIFLATVAALPQGEKQSQQAFDSETHAFRDQGLCRNFQGRDDSYIELCKPYCEKQVKEGERYSSTTCNSSSEELPESVAPDGRVWKLGFCQCSNEILEFAAEVLVEELLPELGRTLQVACEAIFEVLDYASMAADVALMVVPGGQFAAAARMSVRAARVISEAGGTSSDLMTWFGSPCGGDQGLKPNADTIMKDLLNVPTDLVSSCPPKKKKCEGVDDGNDRSPPDDRPENPRPSENPGDQASDVPETVQTKQQPTPTSQIQSDQEPTATTKHRKSASPQQTKHTRLSHSASQTETTSSPTETHSRRHRPTRTRRFRTTATTTSAAEETTTAQEEEEEEDSTLNEEVVQPVIDQEDPVVQIEEAIQEGSS